MQAMMAHSLSNYTRIPTDVYAVVEKKRKIKAEPSNMGNYDVITADANSTTANLYDYTSAPAYGKLDSSHNIQNETMETDKVCGPNKCTEIIFFGRIKYWEHRSVNVATCLAVLITAVIAEVVAVAMAFVLIAGIRSDLTAALRDSSSSPGSSSENAMYITISLEPQLNQLHTDFNNFTANTYQQFFYMNQNISDNAEYLNRQINSTFELIRYLNDKSNLLLSSVNALEKIIHEQQNDIYDNATSKIKNLNNTVVEEIRTASNISLAAINTLTDRLASGIQDLHTFDSCAAVSAFPIQLTSGMYNITSGTSTKLEYCSTTIALSCNNIPGKWRRIAYLNTGENPVTCPVGFEVRSDTSNPPLCRHKDGGAGCSSVTYPSNGTSYSQVCGRVRIHQQETPDGFQSDFSNIPRNGPSVDQNYVDGVSLTHGTNPNRNHIWTYTAVIKFGADTDRCTICGRNKPFYVGTNFTCTAEHCRAWPCDLIMLSGLMDFPVLVMKHSTDN